MTDCNPSEPDAQRTCCECGDQYPRNRRGPSSIRCPKCQKLHHAKVCKEGAQRRAAQAKPVPKPVDKSQWIPCPYCGESMPPTHGGRPRRQCGAPECARLHTNAEQRRYLSRYTREHGISYAWDKYPEKRRAAGEASRRQWKEQHPEEWAAQLAQLHEKYTVERRAKEAKRRRRKRALEKLRRARIGRGPGRRRFVAGTCASCGKPYAGVANGRESRHCSAACGDREKKRRRRARKRGVESTRYRSIDIFERDNWRCQICGKKVNRTVNARHPKAPSIDHIIPLAAMGPDTPENVRCAHRICNSRKGAAGGGQLLLLG